MNYTTLVADRDVNSSIKNWINYGRIDSEAILTEAQAWIYSKIRLPEMVATASVSITSGASTAVLPTGYRDPIQFGIPGQMHRMILKDVEWFRGHLAWDENAVLPDGLPTYWCRVGDLIQLNTLADQAYTASMTYYKTPTALSVSNETNWLTEKYPTLVRRTCLMFAAEFRKEFDVFDREEQRALAAIKEIRIEGDEQLRGISLDFHWGADSEGYHGY